MVLVTFTRAFGLPNFSRKQRLDSQISVTVASVRLQLLLGGDAEPPKIATATIGQRGPTSFTAVKHHTFMLLMSEVLDLQATTAARALLLVPQL